MSSFSAPFFLGHPKAKASASNALAVTVKLPNRITSESPTIRPGLDLRADSEIARPDSSGEFSEKAQFLSNRGKRTRGILGLC